MHSEQLDPRPVVIITGGGSGIGAAAAERLAQDYRVVICAPRAGGSSIAGQTRKSNTNRNMIEFLLTVELGVREWSRFPVRGA